MLEEFYGGLNIHEGVLLYYLKIAKFGSSIEDSSPNGERNLSNCNTQVTHSPTLLLAYM